MEILRLVGFAWRHFIPKQPLMMNYVKAKDNPRLQWSLHRSLGSASPKGESSIGKQDYKEERSRDFNMRHPDGNIIKGGEEAEHGSLSPPQARRTSKQGWDPGQGSSLPTWLHIIIRKRRDKEKNELTRDKPNRQGPGRPMPAAPAELTSQIMGLRSLHKLLEIIDRHSPGGIFSTRPLSHVHVTALYRQAAWIASQKSTQQEIKYDTTDIKAHRYNLTIIIEKLNIRLFQVLSKMDMLGISQVLWSLGKMRQKLDPVLREAMREHVVTKVSPTSKSSLPTMDSRLISDNLPRAYYASASELVELCVGLSWLRIRLEADWQPLLSAITRNAGHLSYEQLAQCLLALQKCRVVHDTRLQDALASRLLEILSLQDTREEHRSFEENSRQLHCLALCSHGLWALGVASPRVASAVANAANRLCGHIKQSILGREIEAHATKLTVKSSQSVILPFMNINHGLLNVTLPPMSQVKSVFKEDLIETNAVNPDPVMVSDKREEASLTNARRQCSMSIEMIYASLEGWGANSKNLSDLMSSTIQLLNPS